MSTKAFTLNFETAFKNPATGLEIGNAESLSLKGTINLVGEAVYQIDLYAEDLYKYMYELSNGAIGYLKFQNATIEPGNPRHMTIMVTPSGQE